MAFYIVTGTMGGGKSYYAVEECLRFFKRGCHVHTFGVDLLPDEVEARGFSDQWTNLPEDITQWEAMLVPGKEGVENLLVCDEAGLLLSVDDQQKDKDKKKPFYEWLVWSRRYGLHVLFLVQHAANIEVKLRRLAAGHIHCLNVSTVPLVGGFVAKLLGDFRRTRLNPKGKELTASYHRFSKEVATFYDTHGWAGRKAKVNDTDRKTGEGVKNRSFLGVSTVLGLLLLVMVVGFWRVAHSLRNPPESAITKALEDSKKRAQAPSTVPMVKQSTARPGLESVMEVPAFPSMYEIPLPAEEKLVTVIRTRWGIETITTLDGGEYTLGRSAPEGTVTRIWKRGPERWQVIAGGREITLRRISSAERYSIWKYTRTSLPSSSPAGSPDTATMPLGSFSMPPPLPATIEQATKPPQGYQWGQPVADGT